MIWVPGLKRTPCPESFDHKYSLGALDEISKQQDRPIRVIYITRNILDRYRLTCNSCKSRDKKKVHFPTGRALVNNIALTDAHDEYVEERLGRAGVKHLRVSYEMLYYGKTTSEWVKIFKFLERGPTTKLTMDMLRDASSIKFERAPIFKSIIVNFKHVYKTLKGGRYVHLLHRGKELDKSRN